ncbi:MAG: hypothetical protein H0X66_14265 [Verrucomicrobia bacterium]|nr:hypothetical protein [Verrucomicrobiota bacterium]
MKLLLLFAFSTALLTGCYTDRTYQSGDVLVEPAGAEVLRDIPGETWSEDPRDIHQRPYRRQFETERHQQFQTDPPFTHDRLD